RGDDPELRPEQDRDDGLDGAKRLGNRVGRGGQRVLKSPKARLKPSAAGVDNPERWRLRTLRIPATPRRQADGAGAAGNGRLRAEPCCSFWPASWSSA